MDGRVLSQETWFTKKHGATVLAFAMPAGRFVRDSAVTEYGGVYADIRGPYPDEETAETAAKSQQDDPYAF